RLRPTHVRGGGGGTARPRLDGRLRQGYAAGQEETVGAGAGGQLHPVPALDAAYATEASKVSGGASGATRTGDRATSRTLSGISAPAEDDSGSRSDHHLDDSGRVRTGHECVPGCAARGQLGRSVPGQSRERRQTSAVENAQGQRVFAAELM